MRNADILQKLVESSLVHVWKCENITIKQNMEFEVDRGCFTVKLTLDGRGRVVYEEIWAGYDNFKEELIRLEMDRVMQTIKSFIGY